MKKLSLSQRLWIVTAAVWVGLLSLGVFDAFKARALMVAERQAALKSVIDIASNIVGGYYDLSRNGTLAPEEAKRQALARVKDMRYGTSGYVLVDNSQGIVLMHPTIPAQIGKETLNAKDGSGKLFIREIIDVASKGGGFVNYTYLKPDTGKLAPKLSYVRRFDPWDWNLISGVYSDDINDTFRGILLRALAAMALIGGIVTVVTMRITRGIRRELGGEPDYAATIVGRVADGDLTVSVESSAGDERSLLATMARMQRNLSSIVGRIRGTADSLTTAAQQIAAGNTDLSARTEQQAASLQETAASMEQLTATVKQNAESASHANHLAGDAAAAAARGGKVVDRVVGTMQGIHSSSSKISDIIGVIDGIAFQTNILALNAAVEAARAGEQGRGFAVVAGEVRTLAQRSATAAKEIKDLIVESAERVRDGSAFVEEAGGAMREIVDSIERVRSIIAEIAAASTEQSTGIEQVNRAIAQIDEVTQQNAALVEQASAATSMMVDQTQQLITAVAAFRTQAAREEAL
ncbi:methyl-accepting chemotaxis protein [Paraburkholderia kururiensis]|uniref:methyl-accepting chemotaxis protein n=1 Tax=Paraburkholderia kururiensis TaxID=984307 RepID=UPI001F290160|nr:methyl-accepting chemotaxis protein [Paraburkholderia kururiensis]